MKIGNFTNSTPKTIQKIAFTLLFSFVSLLSFSQNTSFISMTDYLSQNNVANKSSKVKSSSELEKLVFDKQNAVYVNATTSNVYGSNPVAVFSSINTVSRLFSDNFDRSNVKIINLQVNSIAELSNIDLSNLSSFPNLKYIFFSCKFPVTANHFSQVNTGNQTKIEFIYYYEKPS